MQDHSGFSWLLLVIGLVIALVGVIWIVAPSLPWLDRLPGDIRYEERIVPHIDQERTEETEQKNSFLCCLCFLLFIFCL